MTVLVTGAGVLCATAADVDGFAAALRAGRSGIAARGTGELSADLAGFDFDTAVAARRRLPEPIRRTALRAAARAPLPVQAAVTVALQAWESAGLHAEPVPAGRTGVVVGGHNLGGAYADAVRPRYRASPAYLPGRYALRYLDTDHVGTVSQVLGITGEGCTVGGASASGNVAIVHGCRLVACGEADACLVIGALTELSAMERQAFVNLGALAVSGAPAVSGALAASGGPAASGGRPNLRKVKLGTPTAHSDADPATRCRPFDEDRAGFVPGQAAAALVLESAESARRRGVAALATVAGYALRLDGNSLADPDPAGEAGAMVEALRRAGLSPGEVDYVNTHGTGSRLGDEAEVAALRKVFGSGLGRPWLNSTKGLVGHCLCAAGVVEAVATLVQLRDGFVHPNANLARPIDAECRFAGALAEPAELTVAMSNGFGFGGFNSSVVFVRPDR